jgi:hypothetical protein
MRRASPASLIDNELGPVVRKLSPGRSSHPG